MSKTNPRITKKERGLIKGYVRRVFSRSELRDKALQKVRISGYADPSKPRVKRWCYCPECGVLTPEWKMEVDHVDPVVPLDRSFADMDMEELIDRQWCPEENLVAKCDLCHQEKTQSETKTRAAFKRARKQGEKNK